MLTTALGQLTKLASLFIFLKLSSYYLGPEGLGFLGNAMSVITILVLLSGGGITNAVIKYVSEYKSQGESQKIQRFLNCTVSFAIFASILFTALSLIFYEDILFILFEGQREYSWILAILILSQFVFSLINIFSGYYNGIGDNHKFSLSQITSFVVAIPIVWYLIVFLQVKGAVLGLLVLYALPVIPLVYFFIKQNIVSFSFVKPSVSEVQNLSRFSLMMIVSSIAFPVTEIFVRQLIVNNSGLAEAGYWQSLIKLSSAYFSCFSIVLAYYFLPKISSSPNISKIKELTLKAIGIISSLFFIMALVVFFNKELVIGLVFSDKFLVVGHYILYQLVGDLFRICCFVFGFIVVAKAATKLYVLGEIIQSSILIGFVFYFSGGDYDAKNVAYSYMLTYIFYFFICLFIFFYWVSANKVSNEKLFK